MQQRVGRSGMGVACMGTQALRTCHALETANGREDAISNQKGRVAGHGRVEKGETTVGAEVAAVMVGRKRKKEEQEREGKVRWMP